MMTDFEREVVTGIARLEMEVRGTKEAVNKQNGNVARLKETQIDVLTRLAVLEDIHTSCKIEEVAQRLIGVEMAQSLRAEVAGAADVVAVNESASVAEKLDDVQHRLISVEATQITHAAVTDAVKAENTAWHKRIDPGWTLLIMMILYLILLHAGDLKNVIFRAG